MSRIQRVEDSVNGWPARTCRRAGAPAELPNLGRLRTHASRRIPDSPPCNDEAWPGQKLHSSRSDGPVTGRRMWERFDYLKSPEGGGIMAGRIGLSLEAFHHFTAEEF